MVRGEGRWWKGREGGENEQGKRDKGERGGRETSGRGIEKSVLTTNERSSTNDQSGA
jgi:hypothetical protein